MMNGLLFVSILLLNCHVTATSQPTKPDPQTISRIDDFVNGVMSCYEVPGLTLAVVRDKVPFLAKGYGLKDLDTQEPVTNQTIFMIASVTKQFASTIVGQVLAKHNLTYDTPVRNILGDWFYMKDPYLTSKLTVRDALAHRSGLPLHNTMQLYMYPKRDLYERLRYLDLTAPPRSEYKYNNLMYGLASYVAETLEGRDWEDLAQDQIFTPLGMTSTTFPHLSTDRYDEYATPYEYGMAEMQLRPVDLELYSITFTSVSAQGGIASSAVDMTKWLAVQVNQGYTEANVSVISEGILRETHEPAMAMGSTPEYLKPSEPVTMAMSDSYTAGFEKGYYRGYSMLSHGGAYFGIRSRLAILPDMGVGVFIGISGPMHDVLNPIIFFVMDLMLGKEPWLTVEDVCDQASVSSSYIDGEQVINGPTTSGEIRNDYPGEKLVGSYFNYAYGEVRVTYDGILDILRLHYGPFLSFAMNQLVPGEPWYEGFGIDPFWMTYLSNIEFNDCGGLVCERLDLSFDFESPPTFHRTLPPAPAPEPPCPSK